MVSLLGSENSTNVRANVISWLFDAFAEEGRAASPAEKAALDFITPERHVAPPMLPEPSGGTVLAVPGWSPHLAARLWGGHLHGAPTVLLLHGWEGQMYDMVGFVQTLLDRGYRVVALDAPAHGRSSGETATLTDFARAAAAVAAIVGPLAGAIGHSLGGTALALAAEEGAHIPRLALIGAPAHPLRFALGTARRHRLDADQTGEMLRLIGKAAGRRVEAVSLPAIAAGLSARGMVVHSAEDRIVPVADALETAGSWPGARLHLVDGLGHRRLLSDPGVVQDVVDWMSGPST